MNIRPIDLNKVSGGRYKLGLDMACPKGSIKKADPWDLVIKCKNGEIFPYSDKLLAFHCVKGIIRNRLNANHKEIEVRNWSDNGEAIFLFRQEDFDLIAAYAAPRKVRRLSEKHKAELVNAASEALKRYRKANSKVQDLRQNQSIII